MSSAIFRSKAENLFLKKEKKLLFMEKDFDPNVWIKRI